ncbi:MAG TPA: 2-oxo acid dehydrogenase subunit E2 [Mycobacteriales bacterium]|nr:2-oxo acid dehydrogenase subunit E2 [Mycobacteriales bacterium]
MPPVDRSHHAAQPPRRLHGWRKLAGSSWLAPFDPQFFGDMEIDAANLLAEIEDIRRHTGEHVTITHAVVKAVAAGLQAVPALNVRLTRGREHPRESIDVLVIVAVGDELTGVKVEAADRKSLAEIAAEIERRTALIRDGRDAEFGRTKRMLEVLPPRLLRLGIRFSAWLTSDLNLNLPRLGLPRQAFGSAMVSSIGMTGITHAYSPLASYYRVPLLILVGAVHEKAVVVNGMIVARPVLTLTATFDHRYTDGLQAVEFANAARAYLAAPHAAESVIHLDKTATQTVS